MTNDNDRLRLTIKNITDESLIARITEEVNKFNGSCEEPDKIQMETDGIVDKEKKNIPKKGKMDKIRRIVVSSTVSILLGVFGNILAKHIPDPFAPAPEPEPESTELISDSEPNLNFIIEQETIINKEGEEKIIYRHIIEGIGLEEARKLIEQLNDKGTTDKIII